MHRILGYIRKNKFQVILIILFIIFIYSLIHTANNEYKNRAKEQIQNGNNESIIKTDGTITLSDSNCKKVIKEFLEKSTRGNYEEAYNYLSEECKEQDYPNLEDFINNYCNLNVIKGKGYLIENTKERYKYKIEFNDILSSGNSYGQKDIHYYKINVENGHDIKITIER